MSKVSAELQKKWDEATTLAATFADNPVIVAESRRIRREVLNAAIEAERAEKAAAVTIPVAPVESAPISTPEVTAEATTAATVVAVDSVAEVAPTVATEPVAEVAKPRKGKKVAVVA